MIQFVDIGSRECYVGMLYACYDLLRPDLVLELSWRHGLTDFTMPFLITTMRQQTLALETLQRDNEARKAREASQQKQEADTPILGGSRLMLTQGPAGAAPPPMMGAQPTGMGAMGSGTGTPVPYRQTNGITPQPTGYRAF